MDKFLEGNIVYHKSTGKRCVVLCKNEDGTFKVRTQDDLERDYRDVELKTQEEEASEIRRLTSQIPEKDWSI